MATDCEERQSIEDIRSEDPPATGQEHAEIAGPKSATTLTVAGSQSSTEASYGKEKQPLEARTTARDEPSSPPTSIRSRPSRHSTIENGEQHSETAEKQAIEHECDRGLIRRTPLYRHPVKEAERWHDEADVPPQWTSLFYDLVVVAVLTVFGLTHDLSEPSAIPVFLGYFTVIYWVWTSQVFYDIRYEAEDAVHRFFKFLQVCVFLYIGAASGKWDPGNIRTARSEGLIGEAAANTEDAEESFKTVVIAFAASRAFLALQYLICALVGRKAKRDVACHWVSFITLVISCAMNIVSASVSSHSVGLVALRLIFLYGSIVLEVIMTMTQSIRSSHVRASTEVLGERYGYLSLIILGDGLLNIVRAFNKAIAGLSDRDTGTYAQAFMSVLIVYMLWSFLFSRFDKNAKVTDRNAKVWELLHFPLSFGLLLLLGAIVNVVLVIANGTGTTYVVEGWTNAADRVRSGGMLTQLEMRELGRYLYKLQLEPEWTVQLARLAELWGQANPPQDPEILNVQYLGQIVVTSFELYGLKVPDATYDTLQDLYALNTTVISNSTTNTERADAAYYDLGQVIAEPFTLALTGTLWLYPTAGIILILCAIRTIIWNPLYNSIGHRIPLYFQIAAGVCVALLGLLDIGSRRVDLDLYTNDGDGATPMYILVLQEVPLVIVSGMYAIVFLGPVAVQEWLHRRRGGVYVEEEKGWIGRVRSRIGRTNTQPA